MTSGRDEDMGLDCHRRVRAVYQGVISDNSIVRRNGMLFSQGDEDMIFMLCMKFINNDPEGHCTWKEAEAPP